VGVAALALFLISSAITAEKFLLCKRFLEKEVAKLSILLFIIEE
jgi:hypothetical protein